MCIFSVFINDAGPAFLVGFLAHIIPDMLTSHGIKLFWPFKLTVRFPITCSTGSGGEMLFSGFMMLLCIINIGKLFGV